MKSPMTVALVVLVVACLHAPRPALAQAEDDEEARGLYSAGAAAFAAGRYDDALGYFQHAYELSHRPGLLYNVGQAADRARHDEVALRAFEEYLEVLPDAPNRTEIEGRIRVLRTAVAAHAVAPAPVETPPTETPTTELSEPSPVESTAVMTAPPPASADLDVGAIVLTAVGGVAVVTGAILLGVGAPDLYAPREGLLFAPENDRYVNAQVLVGAGSAVLGAGLIAAVIGVVMLTSGSGRSTERAAASLSPNGFVLVF
jgi:tetratricopeptide (TPR) repeat protein